jgi:hypothetical protein
MSFVINPGTVASPLTAGGIAYGTGSQVKVNSAGTSGQVLLSNGASTPTWGTVASGATTTAIASGTIATGQTVILQSDGTVKIATQTPSTTQTSGTANLFASYPQNALQACYDSVNKKIVVVLADNTANLNGYVGTISGTTISFGSVSVATSANYIQAVVLAFNPIAGKFIVFNQQPTNGYLSAIVGQVVGTSITWGASTAYNGGIPSQACFDAASGNILCTFYQIFDTKPYCLAVSLGVSSITFGTPVALNANASSTYYQACCYDSNNATSVVFYTVSNGGGGYNLFSRTATVSGTTVTLGTETNIDTNGGKYMSAIYDPINQKSLITYLLIGYNYLSCRVITATGSSISSGSRVDIVANSYVNTWAWSTVDPSTGYINIIWSQYTSTIGVFTVVGYISGTTFTFGSSVRQNTIANINGISTVYDENTKKVANFYYNTTAYSSALITNFYSTNLTSTNFLGFSAATYSNGQTATINVISSTDNNQTSLTPGNGYYVQNDGTLSTTAASPSVYAGLALTSTKILVKG